MGSVVITRPLNHRVKRLDIGFSPRNLFTKLLRDFPNVFLLESAKGKSRLAEYSFLGFEPSVIVQAKNGVLEVEDAASG